MVSDTSAEDRLERRRGLALWALERWRGFPVDANPRPWVFVGSIVRPQRGFRTGEAKLSFLTGNVTSTVPVPDEVLGLVRQSRSQVTGATHSLPLVINRAWRSKADFLTDRGHTRFLAWGLDGEALIGPIWVLDPDIASKQWTPSEPPRHPRPSRIGGIHRSFRSSLEDDGRTLHYQFTGGPPGYEEYPDAVVMETAHAVAVIPIAHGIGRPGPRRLLGYRREVVVRLGNKLGARVLVNLDSSPVVVGTLEDLSGGWRRH